MGSDFLQTFLFIFIIANVFAIGFLTSIGIRHLRAHLKPGDSDAPRPHPVKKADVRITPELREKLLRDAEAHFQIVVTSNATKLARDLEKTTAHAVGELEKISEEAIARQSLAYGKTLDDVAALNEGLLARSRDLATKTDSQAATQTTDFTAKLSAELDAAGKARIAQRVAEIDDKLSDAVVSFLVESLGHEIDLGAQMKYILARLEENKDAIKSEVAR